MDNINDLITKEINERTGADMDSSVCSRDWKKTCQCRQCMA